MRLSLRESVCTGGILNESAENGVVVTARTANDIFVGDAIYALSIKLCGDYIAAAFVRDGVSACFSVSGSRKAEAGSMRPSLPDSHSFPKVS